MDKKLISESIGIDLSGMKEKRVDVGGDFNRAKIFGVGFNVVWVQSKKTGLTIFSQDDAGIDAVAFSLKNGKLKLKLNSGGGDDDETDGVHLVNVVNTGFTDGSEKDGGGGGFQQNFTGHVGLVIDGGASAFNQTWEGAIIDKVVVQSEKDVGKVSERYAGAKIGKIVVAGGGNREAHDWKGLVLVLESPEKIDIQGYGAGSVNIINPNLDVGSNTTFQKHGRWFLLWMLLTVTGWMWLKLIIG